MACSVELHLEEAESRCSDIVEADALLFAFAKRSLEGATKVLRVKALKVFVHHKRLLFLSDFDLNLSLIHGPDIMN